MANKFGVTLTFIATRSGLTRFEDHWIKNASPEAGPAVSTAGDNSDEGQALADSDNYEPVAPSSRQENFVENDSEFDDEFPEVEEPGNGTQFAERHSGAIDEPFYRRAVDFHHIDETAFVYSVPYAIGQRAEAQSEVTASRAILVGGGQERAPAAVVGLRMRLKTFSEKFFNSSSRCDRGQCVNLCQREGVNGSTTEGHRCMLLDNNGYVLVDSQTHASSGRLLGELDQTLFGSLIETGIFRHVRMFDYQAICIEMLEKPTPVGSGTARLLRNTIGLMFTTGNELIRRWWRLTSLWAFEAYMRPRVLVEAASNVFTQSWSIQNDADSSQTSGTISGSGGEVLVSDQPSMRGMAKDVKGKLLPPNRTRPYPCDKEFFLYELTPGARSELASRPLRKEYTKCDDCQQ